MNASASTQNRAGMWILGLMLALMMVGFSSCTFGNISGEEFNPYTFQRRGFHYLEIPWIRVQVSATTQSPKLNALCQHLQPLLAESEASRWDLIRGRRGSAQPTAGDASILASYFDAEGDEGIVWLHWTRQHPQLAHELWSVVAWLAQHELYLFIPDVFDAAKGREETEASMLRVELQELLQRRIGDAADSLEAAGAPRAAELRTALTKLAAAPESMLRALEPPAEADSKKTPAKAGSAEAGSGEKGSAEKGSVEEGSVEKGSAETTPAEASGPP